MENAACARRLFAIADVLERPAVRADGSAEREQWCLDNWDAVAADRWPPRRTFLWGWRRISCPQIEIRPQVGPVATSRLLPHVKMRARADSLPHVIVRAWGLGLWWRVRTCWWSF